MFVGVMSLELDIPGAESLKDKRRVVRSLKDTCHKHHMVSIAETGSQDIWNRAVLGVACVSQSGGVIGATLDHVLERVRKDYDCELIAHAREIMDVPAPGFSVDPDMSDVSDELLAYAETH